MMMMESPSAMTAATMITTVVAVSGQEVTLGAGSRSGMVMAAEVTLLRQGEPIVHPLTGQILGVPQEPVGVVRVFEVSEQTAKGRLVKAYSDPMVDDLAEYLQTVVERPVPDDVHIPDEFAQRIEDLESSVQGYEKANETLAKTYPTFARRIWDEISAMRAYVVSLDERLVELEEQQREDRSRLASMMTGEYRTKDFKEFTIRYTPDTQIKLQASGKTLLISVVHDTVQIDRSPMGADNAMSSSMRIANMRTANAEREDQESSQLMATIQSWFESDGDGEDEDSDSAEDTGYWIWIAVSGLLIALLIMAILIIKRRYNDVMDGLEEFDEDEYLDEDDEK